MTLPAGARCANHAEQGAVDVCGRCGGFICADCLQLWREELVYCPACFERAGVDRASRRSTAALVLALGSALPVAGGCLLGRALALGPVAGWAGAVGLSVSALVLGRLELVAIGRGDAPLGGRRRAWVALWLAAVSLVGLVLMLAAVLVLARLDRGGA